MNRGRGGKGEHPKKEKYVRLRTGHELLCCKKIRGSFLQKKRKKKEKKLWNYFHSWPLWIYGRNLFLRLKRKENGWGYYLFLKILLFEILSHCAQCYKPLNLLKFWSFFAPILWIFDHFSNKKGLNCCFLGLKLPKKLTKIPKKKHSLSKCPKITSLLHCAVCPIRADSKCFLKPMGGEVNIS